MHRDYIYSHAAWLLVGQRLSVQAKPPYKSEGTGTNRRDKRRRTGQETGKEQAEEQHRRDRQQMGCICENHALYYGLADGFQMASRML